MNLPTPLQQAVNQWADRQGISSEQFIITAVTEKLNHLNQVQDPLPAIHSQPTLQLKEGLLVIESEWPDLLDMNTLIESMREDRIQEQMVW